MPTLSDSLSGLAGGSLTARVKAALAALDAQEVIAYIDYAVKSRTQRGQFLPGSSASAGSYSKGYRRQREKAGLQTARVDLFVTGRMLDATRARPETFGDQVRLSYGYIDGLSEAEATRLATYHNSTGRTVRRFIGLTDDERAQALKILRESFTAGLARP